MKPIKDSAGRLHIGGNEDMPRAEADMMRKAHFRAYGYRNETSPTAVRYLRGPACRGRQIVMNCIEQWNAAHRFASGIRLPGPCGGRSGIRTLVLEHNARGGHRAKRRMKALWYERHFK